MKKLETDRILGILVVIRCRIFCLSVCYPKNVTIKLKRTIILSVAAISCVTWPLN